LLESIREYLQRKNKILYKKGNFYLLEVYRHSVFDFLKFHFEKYPLLGQKRRSFRIFVENMKNSNEVLRILSVMVSYRCEKRKVFSFLFINFSFFGFRKKRKLTGKSKKKDATFLSILYFFWTIPWKPKYFFLKYK
jgi:hypothetical protein